MYIYIYIYIQYIYIYICIYIYTHTLIARPAGEWLPGEPGLHAAARARRGVALARPFAAAPPVDRLLSGNRF